MRRVPTVELFDSDEGLIFDLTPATSSAQQPPQTQPTPEPDQPETPSAEGDESIELVVTGEQDGYSVPETSTATRTDTPLRDIPQSIQVVPRQVIEDQGAVRIEEALRNVSGVSVSNPSGGQGTSFNARGFGLRQLRNGFLDCYYSWRTFDDFGDAFSAVLMS
ncbi:TonB-dependent receptor plug domain-containing protein [Chlorogloeopsis fritschii PCC 9212]|uniref:TonB-dependent receptor plug domain-containing protein n=1 Tax=Chlorogloeopsis fritschii PCC 6912 TaxID=211165 RepID=A0A3S1ACA9_CHLFR|nr:hypothetical protein PCC6912_48040 [Chlorogloeopsis fritschii PCC 6912]